MGEDELKIGDAVMVVHRGHNVISRVIAIKGDKVRVSYVWTSVRGRQMSSQVHEPWKARSCVGKVAGPAPDSQNIMRGILGLSPRDSKAVRDAD